MTRKPTLLPPFLAALMLLGVLSGASQTVTVNPDPPMRSESVTIHYSATGRVLQGTGQVYIHLGWNHWSTVINPDPAMTNVGMDQWEHTVSVPVDAGYLDCVFNDGAGTWDNNSFNDWHFPTSMDLSGFSLSATPISSSQGGGVGFRVWAPNASSVTIPGQFNSWNTGAEPMSADGDGIWSAVVADAEVGDEYKFFLSGSDYRIDPRSRDTVNSTGNSIVRSDGSDYPWTDGAWQTPDHDQMVIYELHVGTFSGNGDGVGIYPARFRDVVDEHLDELQALGINMVEIMPVHEFPGGVSWGYNPVHLFAPESDYGSPDDLRYLVDQLHGAGIGVILDVVYNHTSTTDNNLWNFDGPANIYFFGENCMGETPWGHTRPRYTEAQVRALIVDNARHWIEEYHMDGLRVDSTANMRGYCNEAGEGWLLMGDIADAARSANPRAILIAEELPNDPTVTTPRAQGGAGYDAQWGDTFNDTLRAQLGVIASSGDPDMAAIADAIVNSGFGRPNDEVVKYVESHDEAGNDQRITALIDPADPFSDRARGLSMVSTGLSIVSPGVPMLFMGQEFLEDKPFDDGADDRIWWGNLTAHAGVRDLLADLISLRTERGSLRAGSGAQIIHINDSAEVIAFQRWDGAGDVTFIIANFSGTDFTSYLVGAPQMGTWHELANSQSPAHGGSGAVNGSLTATPDARDGMPATLDLALPGWSLLVFSQTDAEPEPDDMVGLTLR
ncbi:alpha amylase C-terminal domain-containing protein [Candidatus Sumerlaeota bacterium]|nr:alpha amylase C-terminal domain-containing protein [Candidatus Sumerlaeota bacterium]